MAKKKKIKSKKPSGTGISVKASNSKWDISFKWKKGETYEAQKFRWMTYIAGRKKAATTRKPSIGAKVTAKTVSLSKSSYYPTEKKPKLRAVAFQVRGNGKRDTKRKNRTWSRWSATKMQKIYGPPAPSASFSLSESVQNEGTFSWSTSVSDSSFYWFTDVMWQSVLVASDETNGAKIQGWANRNDDLHAYGSGSASGSKTITEQNAAVLNGTTAMVRWFRVRSRGPAGDSAWGYAHHAYSTPLPATNVSAVMEGGMIQATWSAEASFSRPIDTMTVQWTLATPAANGEAPDDASWTDGYKLNDRNRIEDKKDTYHAGFAYDGEIGEDKVLFVRVNAVHDQNTSPYIDDSVCVVTNGTGRLAAPVINSVEVNEETKTATVNFTNNSSVSDSVIKVFRKGETGIAEELGEAPHGTSSLNVTWTDDYTTYIFGVQAVTAQMASDTVWQNGDVPVAPTNVIATVADGSTGTVQVRWDWNWEAAQGATISWSDHADAWESTDEPEEYTISSINSGRWNIAGLDAGTTWFFRVRFNAGSGDDATQGPWSDITAKATVNISSTPTTPSLTLSKQVITVDETVTAYWAYTSSDGTSQQSALICEAEIGSDGTLVYGDPIATTSSAQSIILSSSALGWTPGTTHYLCVKVVSSSNIPSDGWSAPVAIIVAEPLSATITISDTDTSWHKNATIIDDDEDTSITHEALALIALPVTASVEGAGQDGSVTLAIERAADYHVERPDGTDRDGFEGETIASKTMQAPEEDPLEFSITAEDIIGSLDDGALYDLVATVRDGLGQSDTIRERFEVHWDHQAETPTASASVDAERLAVTITPQAPEGYVEGDVFDIYRLSADPPELIVEGGTFGTSYVDPYPAFGEGCGHRIVDRTLNGDYITAENVPAWVDLDEDDGDVVDCKSIVIEFDDNDRVELPYDISLDNSWGKDFQRTSYLGGSVQGDWNPAVTRDLTVSTDIIVSDDQETISQMRELAMYPGICHVRTPEGSSFAADVQVSEQREVQNQLAAFSLTIKRVESESLEGMTLDEWNALIQSQEGE